jgi:cytochrome c oxidase subunit 2
MRIRLALPTVAVSLISCSGIQTGLSPVGDQARSQYFLLMLSLAVCSVMFVLVTSFLLFSLFRRRLDGGDHEVLPDRSLHRSLWVWSAIIVGALLVLAGASFWVDRSFALAQNSETLQVRVTAHQWWWRIAYRNPVTGDWIETANELHLPVDRTTRIELGSADVIHSFWVPNVAGKMDVIPGHANAIDLTPRQLGWFRGQCAEFCGAQHARMAFDVKIETSNDFDRWLRTQAEPVRPPIDAVEARGMEIVTTGACAMCHVLRGTSAAGRAGPDLTHVGSRRTLAAGTLPMNRGNLEGWIAQPQALKPGTMMPAISLGPSDADAVAHYLEHLQ